MKQRKTEAIILTARDIFDADRSLLLFTRELGKVRARARGVRKPTSKLTGHLLAYLPTQLELLEGSSGLLVTQAQVVSGHEDEGVYPLDPLLFMRQAEIIAEAINQLFIEQDPHPVIYDGLVYTLGRLRDLCNQVEEAASVRTVAAEFLLKCLAELGYRPELQACVVSGEEISEDFVAWSSQAGGVLSKTGQQQSSGGRVLRHSRSIVLLRQFLRPQFTAERIAVSSEIKEEACQLVYDYLQTTTGQPLRSLV